MPFTRVATVDQLADGALMEVLVDGREVCLARVGADFFAISNICSHMHAWLDGGDVLPATNEVQCPLHNSRFSLRTGEPTGAPATEPIDTFAVRVEGAAILISLDEE